MKHQNRKYDNVKERGQKLNMTGGWECVENNKRDVKSAIFHRRRTHAHDTLTSCF